MALSEEKVCLIPPIEIVYHVATMNNWDRIVYEQLCRIDRSGLGDACDRITITMVGEKIEELLNLVARTPFNQKIEVLFCGELNLCEFPAMERVELIAKANPNALILYIHTKGVTRYEEAVAHWRYYMEYFTIDRWKECIEALESHDICGVEYLQCLDVPTSHFAGNFWWGRADYISTCKLQYNTRFSCENFIGTGTNPRVKCFHTAGTNPKVIEEFPFERFPQYYNFFPYDFDLPYRVDLYRFNYLEKYYRE